MQEIKLWLVLYQECRLLRQILISFFQKFLIRRSKNVRSSLKLDLDCQITWCSHINIFIIFFFARAFRVRSGRGVKKWVLVKEVPKTRTLASRQQWGFEIDESRGILYQRYQTKRKSEYLHFQLWMHITYTI